ncbi:MAG: tetratricopeptide repeat protein [Acidobacteria bacterium]|nr:tetratricopeptide repeat protein [Acidobacteriota bacterium]MCB9397594.1 tetratricopeptide repeat protein [Acidobacteriota bacterium]
MLLFILFCFGDALHVESPQEIMALSPEMQTYISGAISDTEGQKEKVYALIDLIFSEKHLGLTYGNNRTRTASETFESRQGNCLSFTSMFVAMARHVGLSAQFQEVLDVSTYNKRGQVVVNNKHMNAIVMVNGRRLEVDFQPYAERKKHLTRIVSDAQAFAHFYNNKGAEAFADNHWDLSNAYFHAAMQVEPNFARTYSNYGVLLKRLGDLKGAEEAYLKALDLDDDEYTAMSNLAQLYEGIGRADLAEKFQRKVERHRNKNPYYHYSLALDDYDVGNYGSAIDHLKKALRLHPRESDFYHAIARAYWQTGDQKTARKNLELAERFAMSEEERSRYNMKLDLLFAQK